MKKKIILTVFALLSTVIVVIYLAVTDGKTNNIPDSLEKFVPKFVKNFIMNDVFVVRNLKRRINNYEKSLKSIGDENRDGQKINDILLDRLYESGLENLEFSKVRSEELLSNKSNSFNLKTFETYYLSAGTWPHTRASAYFERHEDKIILVSKNAIIETVAEAILTEQGNVAVVDEKEALVGSIHASKIIQILFGNTNLSGQNK